MAAPIFPREDLASFTAHLASSTRIMALLGAGLSASSGLPTFRGPGGYWRNYRATALATPEAFARDPGLVWQFYSYRRHMALNAKPNRAHMALAELARRRPQFLTLSQNVDGLSPRAHHPASQLKLLHGNLYDVKCVDEAGCGYIRHNDFTDPIVPALAIPAAEEALRAQNSSTNSSSNQTTTTTPLDISLSTTPLPPIPPTSLPICPKCSTSLLRPGVVWFGEALPTSVLHDVHTFISDPSPIDLMLVIGTSSVVQPAAGYTDIARSRGARVAIINMDPNDAFNMEEGDWFFHGDAAVIVPEILKTVIGETPEFEDVASGVTV